MANRKPKSKTSPSPASPPPVAYTLTEDLLRSERIEEIKQLPYCELTERIGADGLPVAGSWSLPEGLAFPVSHHGQRPVWGVHSPWEESIILAPDQEGSFVRIQLLPAHPLTADQLRVVLIKKIEQLSETIPLASIQMVQLTANVGQSERDISAYPQDFPSPYNNPRRWPIEGVRTLWEESVPSITGATLNPDDADGGFIRWLWTQVQKLWDIRKVEGVAIDPYGLWLKALNRHQNAIPFPYNDPVASYPQRRDG